MVEDKLTVAVDADPDLVHGVEYGELLQRGRGGHVQRADGVEVFCRDRDRGGVPCGKRRGGRVVGGAEEGDEEYVVHFVYEQHD